jgi:hypothetical protein
MFANKLRIVLRDAAGDRPLPKAWLDQFFMRSFTGYSAFDETLPVADGELEAAHSVSARDVLDRLDQWLRGRKMISPDSRLVVTSCQSSR